MPDIYTVYNSHKYIKLITTNVYAKISKFEMYSYICHSTENVLMYNVQNKMVHKIIALGFINLIAFKNNQLPVFLSCYFNIIFETDWYAVNFNFTDTFF